MKDTVNPTTLNDTMFELHTSKTWNGTLTVLYREFHEALLNLRDDCKNNPGLYKKTLKSPKDLKEDLFNDPTVCYPRLWNLIQDTLSPDEFERIRLGYFYVLGDRALDNRWTAAEKALIRKNMEWLRFYVETLNSLEDLAYRTINAYLLAVSVDFDLDLAD